MGESREARARGKAVIPERAVLGVAVAEFEGEPAEDQGEQHQQDREIDGRNDDGEGDREGGEQADAAENEPSLVAVPDRRDRVHHQVARITVGREIVEHADAEIEAVERDIQEDADGEDGGPDRNQVERGHQRVSAVTDASASIGDFGRPLPTAASSSEAAGPRQTKRSMV